MRYIIIGRAAALHCGVLELTDRQAKPRLHNLKDLGEGRYEIVRSVEFKQGEEIGYDGDLPKSMGVVMAPAAKVRKPKAEG